MSKEFPDNIERLIEILMKDATKRERTALKKLLKDIRKEEQQNDPIK